MRKRGFGKRKMILHTYWGWIHIGWIMEDRNKKERK